MTPIIQETLQTLELIRISCQPSYYYITDSDVKKHPYLLDWIRKSRFCNLKFNVSKIEVSLERLSIEWYMAAQPYVQKQCNYYNKIWFWLVRYASKTFNWNMLIAFSVLEVALVESVSKFLYYLLLACIYAMSKLSTHIRLSLTIYVICETVIIPFALQMLYRKDKKQRRYE